MFTVKFYRYLPNGEECLTAISAINYSSYSRSNGSFEITTYKDMTDMDGVCRNISEEEQDFDSCYIENSSGKTIARYSYSTEARF